MSIKKTEKPRPSQQQASVFVGQSEASGPAAVGGGGVEREPDLVTAIFDLLEGHPAIKEDRDALEGAVRHHFKGMRGTVTERPDATTTARRVLSLFNGRNAREVARKLRVSRGHVYRLIKQPGLPSQ